MSNMMQRIVGKSDFVPVSYLEFGMLVAQSVGRVLIGGASGRAEGFGTGFLVSPRLLLTNNHVLGVKRQAALAQVEFNYQNAINGRSTRAVVFDLDPDTFFITDEALDYSLIAVREQSREGDQLRAFGWNRLIETEGKAILGEWLTIIQHPGGAPKQVALRENQLIDVLPDFVHYQTDTSAGSSGSPVFNDQWEVVALHHSGVPRTDDQGRILNRDGSIWSEEMGEHQIDWIANEGVRVSRIVQDIKKQRLTDDRRKLRNQLFDAEPSQPSLPNLPNPSGPLQTPPATDTRPMTPAPTGDSTSVTPVTVDAGIATWTIPLQISVRLGQATISSVPGAPPAPAVEPTPAIEEDDELRDALAELEASQNKTYYDAEKDKRDREAYYGDLNSSIDSEALYAALNNLLEQTHTTKLDYKPSRHLYPWVDLHPNRKLRSIYSGDEVDAETFIRKDAAIAQELTRERARLQSQFSEALRADPVLGAARLEAMLNALEASMPFNCEHVVPQSWFDKRSPMRGDLHHLFACEVECNSFRSNTPFFDFEDFGETVRSRCGKSVSEQHQFEPEAGKGAAARATLYFLLRYPGEIDSTTREYKEDRLAILLRWHQQHPVTDYERHRNVAIFEKQGNRNPLIDMPELAEKIAFKQGLG
jgi:endonuclease I/V8-like Glu-specific endopeptidase